MIYKMFYSDVTQKFYPDLIEAQQAEIFYNEQIEKFDETRKEYLEELAKLKEKYGVQLQTLLENIQSIVDSSSFSRSSSVPGATLGEWDIIK